MTKLEFKSIIKETMDSAGVYDAPDVFVKTIKISRYELNGYTRFKVKQLIKIILKELKNEKVF